MSVGESRGSAVALGAGEDGTAARGLADAGALDVTGEAGTSLDVAVADDDAPSARAEAVAGASAGVELPIPPAAGWVG